MTTQATVPQSVRYSRAGKKPCPQCNAGLFRIPRHMTDRVTGLVVPVHRYRCDSFTCQWEGTLRVTRRDFSVTDVGSGGTITDGVPWPLYAPRRKAPASFVANMVLSGVGVVLVMVLATTDLFSNPEVANAGAHDQQWLASAKLSGEGTRLAPARQPPLANAPAVIVAGKP